MVDVVDGTIVGVSHPFWVGNFEPKVKADHGFCRFATTLPNYKPTKDDRENIKRARRRLCIQKILNHCMRNPQDAEDIWSSIDTKLIGSSTDDASTTAASRIVKQENVASFGRLSSAAKATIISLLPQGPKKELLDMIDDKDPMAIHDIFDMIFHTCKKDRIPENCRQLNMLTSVLLQRQVGIPFDYTEWIKECILEDYAIDWAKRPLYKFQYEERQLKTMSYWNGDEATIPSWVLVKQGTPFIDAMSHDQARFQKDDTPIPVLQWFRQGEGPNRFRLDGKSTVLEKAAVGISTEVSQRKKELVALEGQSNALVLDSRLKRQREDALAKVRDARKTKPKILRALTHSSSNPKPLLQVVVEEVKDKKVEEDK